MRKNIVLGAVALGITGVFLTGGIANAGQFPKISLNKTTAVAGDEIKVSGVCYEESWHKSPLRSPALEPGSAVGLAHPEESGPGIVNPAVIGVGKVKKDVKPGTYTVSFDCGSKAVTTKLTIVDPKAKQQPAKKTTPKPAAEKAKEAQVEVKPKGAADTGEGDVAPVVNAAPVQQDSGPGAGVYALGGAGLLAAGGAGAFFLRRRARA